MNYEDCPHWEPGCDAPLCPLQENTMRLGVWFGTDEICRARRYQSLFWVKKQKRIQKAGLDYDDGCFTVEMLEHVDRVTPSLKGADPDDPPSIQRWLKERAAQRERSLQKRVDKKASRPSEDRTLALTGSRERPPP